MIVNANSIVQHAIQVKNGIIKHFNMTKTYHKCKKKYSWEKQVFKSIADTLVIPCDEIIWIKTKKTINIATNVTKNCH